jgi:hypothetical protein
MKLTRLVAVFALVSVVAAGAASSRPASHIPTLFSLFQVNPFLGGQVPPRQYRWANQDVTMFVQFDRSQPADARALLYVGISVKGTFCAETQPRGANGGFTHFHRLNSPTYAAGHGGSPGTEGYWLMWVAVDNFETFDRRKVSPGVDYGFQPTPPPTCGSSPRATFAGPGAHALTRTEVRQLAAMFPDNPLRGGQTAPRRYRWVNGDVLVWIQFDKPDLAKARALRHIGIAKRGVFCGNDQTHPDFAHFQRLKAPTYARGRGGRARTPGLWHLAVSVNAARPGVDRNFEPTRPPDCPKA